MHEQDIYELRLSGAQVELFCHYLVGEEKSPATIEKYLRDVRAFGAYAGGRCVTRALIIEYKQHLQDRNYAVRSIYSMLASLNSFLTFVGWQDCRVKALKLQKQVFCAEEKELTRGEYERLLKAAQGNKTLWLVLQTICSIGIRVSGLRLFMVAAVRHGELTATAKPKHVWC